MLKKLLILFTAILSFATISCKKTDNVSSESTANKIAPNGFKFQTTKTVSVSISTLTNRNKALGRVPLKIYMQSNGKQGQLLYKGFTNAQGILKVSITVPNYVDTVIIDPSYLGLVRKAIAYIGGSSLSCTIGGSNGWGGNVIGTLSEKIISSTTIKGRLVGSNSINSISSMDINGIKTSTKFTYLSNYDENGRPYILEPSDEISSDMLNSINASVPEGSMVPNLHPEYIENGTASNIVIIEDAEVFITFTSEGAEYKNTLGFYTYETKNPPATIADINEIKFILPNASLRGSGGTMLSGDKVKLGKFTAGTTIGLVLFANGWNGKNVNTNATAFFTDARFNPETNDDLKRHNVFLKYQDIFVIGFEDMLRDGGSDEDFNDLLVFASSNPIKAISVDGVKETESPVDTDGDGVTDLMDAFPKDAERAYINYYPSKDVWGTLAFEDLFPNTGDYDLNDLVVSYRYSMVSNANNNIVEMTADYQPLAAGASYKNGFGIQFPFSPDLIKFVTGGKISAGITKFNSNGTEAGQKNAVIIPFDDCSVLLKNSNGAFYVNTTNEQSKVTTDIISMLITFNTPISSSTLGSSPFNPFLISNLRRSLEVHLPGSNPTDLADLTKLGTGDDASDPAKGIFYVTKNNYPWALNFPQNFQYPLEHVPINSAYLYFFEWAASGGSLYKDWYINTDAGYRNSKNIYSK